MKTILYTLPITIFKEDETFVAYTASLDVATCGKTEKEARRRFKELVVIFMEELVAMGTAETVLTELGWKKAEGKWSPPLFVSSDTIDINIPAFA